MELIKNNGKVLKKSGIYIKDVIKNKVINNLKIKMNSTKQAKYLFYNYSGTSIDDLISYSDTENVTDMESMFRNCKKIQTIPLLNTSKVTKMKYMFYDSNLQTTPQLDTSNVADMQGMFIYCFQLTTIDITSMDKISSTNNIHYFAYDCRSLTKLIIRNMTVIPPLNTNSFTNCYHFTGTVNSNFNPDGLKDGRIYVPDNMVDQLKEATNWSAYADIIVPLSTLEE